MKVPIIQYQSIEMQQFGAAHWFLPEDETLGFMYIPVGKFWMGSNDLSEDESPFHEVNLPEFWISRYLATEAQYQVFVEESGEARPL